jgi:16S rRNA (cytosine1407-C5)-methyltransferase
VKINAGVVEKNFNTLQRLYGAIIPDISALKDCLYSPLPLAGWMNPLKVSTGQYARLLAEDGITATPMSWCVEGMRFTTEKALGRSWIYAVGMLQIQEEVSMLPSYILAPTADDCVLDMCAAPGNKTAQMSVMMQNRGTLIANDINYNRLKALGSSIRRLGLMNINLTVNNAIGLPVAEPVFDKILVDAPCSCEGTLRKSANKVLPESGSNSTFMSNIQLSLLKKAFAVLKPGGSMVYSTCTFSPEENEMVLDKMLHFAEGELTIEPIVLPGFEVSPGITTWCGQQLDPCIRHAWRIWPHQNNTGGFFIALLKKKDRGASSVKSKAVYNSVDSSVADYIAEMQQRFAIDADPLRKWQFLMPGKRGIFVTNADNLALDPQFLPRVNFDSKGLFFLKTKISYPKLSSGGAMLLGKHIKRHCVELTADQVECYRQREDVSLANHQLINCTSTGYVVVKYDNYYLGMGILFWREGVDHMTMRSLFPKYL